MSKCRVKRCKEESYLIFYGFGVCESCWSKYCDGLLDLKKIFKIKDDVLLTKNVENVNIEKSFNMDMNKDVNIKVFDDWKNVFSMNR